MLKEERSGVSGTLMILVTLFCCMMFSFIFNAMMTSTARSVTESIEHNVAMQCLACIYLDESKSHNPLNLDDPTLKSCSAYDREKNNGEYKPLEQMKQALIDYKISVDWNNPGVHISYNPNDKSGSGVAHATLKLRCNPINLNNDKNSRIMQLNSRVHGYAVRSLLTITPGEAKVTIENNYGD